MTNAVTTRAARLAGPEYRWRGLLPARSCNTTTIPRAAIRAPGTGRSDAYTTGCWFLRPLASTERIFARGSGTAYEQYRGFCFCLHPTPAGIATILLRAHDVPAISTCYDTVHATRLLVYLNDDA